MLQNVDSFIQDLETYTSYTVIHSRVLGVKKPSFGKKISELPLTPVLADHLWFNGVKALYTFQEQALHQILSNNKKNLVITAPTGMGKTEAVLLPLLTKLVNSKSKTSQRKRGVRIILIYPTKALAWDQYNKITGYAELLDISVAKIDGDVSYKDRLKIVGNPPDILLTNIDMIHYHLGQTSLSSDFKRMFQTLEYIIIDELHIYNGAFGTHLKMVLERLKRFSLQEMQFVGLSATLSNAKGFAEEIFQSSVKQIKSNQRLSEILVFLIWPTLKNEKRAFRQLIAFLRKKDMNMLIFENSHRKSEETFANLNKKFFSIALHRGGLSSEKRQEIEEKLRNEELAITVTTPTLELGIDIGIINTVITAPVDYSRFLQRIGRAGRKGQRALAIVRLEMDDPISEFYRRNPNKFFQELSPLFISRNGIIIEKHLVAAANDSPILKSEPFYDKYSKKLTLLARKLHDSGNRLVLRKKGKEIVDNITIRGGTNYQVAIVNKKSKREIGMRAMPLALHELYPGAVYFHAGEKYRVIELSLHDEKQQGMAIVENISSGIPTKPLFVNRPIFEEAIEQRFILELEIVQGYFKIVDSVYGYQRIDKDNSTKNIKGKKEFDPPFEYTYNTIGFLCQFPTMISKHVKEGAYHALAHLLKKAAAPFIGSNNEIQIMSFGSSGALLVYDNKENGGSGFSEAVLNQLNKVIEHAYTMVNTCSCSGDTGCPKCVQSYQCGNNNQPLSKKGAKTILQLVLGENTIPTKLDSAILSYNTFV